MLLSNLPGLTLHGYLSEIVTRAWQDLGTILAKILPRSSHGYHFAMVRSYQELSESHVPKKNFCKTLCGREKNERNSTKINIYANLHCWT